MVKWRQPPVNTLQKNEQGYGGIKRRSSLTAQEPFTSFVEKYFTNNSVP
jgi:hypothetical protein